MKTHSNALLRFLSLVICFTIFLGPSYRVFAQQINGIITGDGVTTRSGPGVEFDKIGRLKTGDRVTVLEEQGRWLRILDAEGREVWVFSRWVDQVVAEEEPEEKILEPALAPKPEVEPETIDTETVTADEAEAFEQPPLITDDEKGGFPWLWVGLGAAAVGAVAVVAASGGDESAEETTGTLLFDIEFP